MALAQQSLAYTLFIWIEAICKENSEREKKSKAKQQNSLDFFSFAFLWIAKWNVYDSHENRPNTVKSNELLSSAPPRMPFKIVNAAEKK